MLTSQLIGVLVDFFQLPIRDADNYPLAHENRFQCRARSVYTIRDKLEKYVVLLM